MNNIKISKEVEEAVQLEIATNYLRGQRICSAPLGLFVQKIVNNVLKRQKDTKVK